MLRTIAQWGQNSAEPVSVKGLKIAPLDFVTDFLVSPAHAPQLKPHLTFWSLRRVTVVGIKNAKPAIYQYTCRDPKGMATLRTCALATELLVTNKIGRKGVLAPEALDPDPFIRQALEWGMLIQEKSDVVY